MPRNDFLDDFRIRREARMMQEALSKSQIDKESPRNQGQADYPYDVALSYAGEDRQYAEKLADALRRRGVKVFYDQYEKPILWGKDLYTHLFDVYQSKAFYCVIFISQHYAKKIWTKHELQAAQSRALRDNKEYILPLRLDDIDIPGILSTVAYLKWHQESVDSIADAIMEKLNAIGSNGSIEDNRENKHRNLPQPEAPTLALIAGLPGSGKTTLALALGHALRWQVVEKDLNKGALLDLLATESDSDIKAGRLAHELAFVSVKDLLLRQKSSVILDSASMHTYIIDQVTSIVKDAKAEFKVILCVASREVRDYRLRNTPNHIASIRVNPEATADYLRLFEHLPPNKLVLDTSLSLETCTSRAIEFLNSTD